MNIMLVRFHKNKTRVSTEAENVIFLHKLNKATFSGVLFSYLKLTSRLDNLKYPSKISPRIQWFNIFLQLLTNGVVDHIEEDANAISYSPLFSIGFVLISVAL